MTETKWTDAKWVVASGGGGDVLIGVEEEVPGGYSFCAVAAAYSHSLIGLDEAQANARLISAAPDMAEALEQLIDCTITGWTRRDLAPDHEAEIVERARSALAKARGET